MKKRFLAGCLAPMFLAGCLTGTNPFLTNSADPTPPGAPTPTNTIPDSIRKNLESASYDAATQTLSLTLTALDGTTLNPQYTRTPGLDIGPYRAFTAQNDPLDRHFIALAAQSRDPGQSTRAVTVADGGQFNRYWGGGYYERTGGYTPPAVAPNSGLVSYAGTYAGVTNVHAPGGNLLPVPPVPPVDPSVLPRQSARTNGEIFMNVDFADNAVNGSIYNRQFTDYGIALPTVVLVDGVIDANGAFLGSVEYENVLSTDIGDFGGIFGGANAGGMAGIVQLTQFDGVGDPLLLDAEQEHGVFVLTQCGLPNAAPICANVN